MTGVEPAFLAWQASVLAIVLHLHERETAFIEDDQST